MMLKSLKRISLALFLITSLYLALAGQGQAQEVVAVLSSDLGPYTEAFEGFQEALGRPVPRFVLTESEPKIGRDTRIVVAFGGKAALREVPIGTSLVYCLAPGTRVEGGTPPKTCIKIHMVPPATSVVSKIRKIQPNIQRLAVLWSSEGLAEQVQRIERASISLGIGVLMERAARPEDLPDRLRALLQRRADAIWLSDDPLLISARSFTVLREFCWANSIPLYAPSAGLAEKGAAVSISCSFREIGLTAARAVQQALSGGAVQEEVYPERFETIVNMTAAFNVGLTLPSSVLSEFDRVLR